MFKLVSEDRQRKSTVLQIIKESVPSGRAGVWMPSYGLLEPKGSKLSLLKSTFDAENFILSLYPMISAQFTLEMCVAARNRENFTTTTILRFKVVQGHRCWYPRKARQRCLL